jgi:hypothetical protein
MQQTSSACDRFRSIRSLPRVAMQLGTTKLVEMASMGRPVCYDPSTSRCDHRSHG